jgi:hypothetical protein
VTAANIPPEYEIEDQLLDIGSVAEFQIGPLDLGYTQIFLEIKDIFKNFAH